MDVGTKKRLHAALAAVAVLALMVGLVAAFAGGSSEAPKPTVPAVAKAPSAPRKATSDAVPRDEVADAMESMEREKAVFGNSPHRVIRGFRLDYMGEGVPARISRVATPANGYTPKDVDRSKMADMACRGEVNDRLRSPSTAVFPSRPTEADRNPDDFDSYRIESYVDAANAFGMPVRTDWICQVVYAGEGSDADPDNWYVRHLEMMPR